MKKREKCYWKATVKFESETPLLDTFGSSKAAFLMLRREIAAYRCVAI